MGMRRNRAGGGGSGERGRYGFLCFQPQASSTGQSPYIYPRPSRCRWLFFLPLPIDVVEIGRRHGGIGDGGRTIHISGEDGSGGSGDGIGEEEASRVAAAEARSTQSGAVTREGEAASRDGVAGVKMKNGKTREVEGSYCERIFTKDLE
ncbi:Os11g0687700 [Oryza sativa Japonica Group]|uniref:Os11g0687700 protein n=3 Tax=Oryza sativa TaxID=4530 RepID=Q2QZG6_ORYSJ|nr:hypothetical protein LOC_Os11g46060 [Oryza sativa Japonica Group]EAZ18755.1 hypothetical protein OsJ_34280 [Oryza sativa Japonica Group]BAT15289.1 Os11g0687700 [Oryza sativa Japonica Group]BBD82550.1 hypothetical protein [Oryza sativa Indica Group]